MLTKESQRALAGRKAVGDACIITASGGPVVNDEDRETYATDAIADILTALFGPAGTMREASDGDGWITYPNEFALNEARRVIEHAFDSYVGDTEDYFESPAFEVIGTAVVSVFTPTPDMDDAWKRFTEGGEVTQDELRELDDQRTTWALEQGERS